MSDHLFDVRSFGPVQVRGSRCGNFFHPGDGVEKHWFAGYGPCKILLSGESWQTQKLAIGLGHSVLQTSLVEHVRRKFGQGRMHSVLDLQTDGTSPDQDQAFKKTLRQTCFRCRLAHHHRPQLTVISNENNLLGTIGNRNQCFCFDSLCCFVDQDLTEPEVFETRISGTNACTANYIRRLENLALRAISQRTVFFLIPFR
mmetsp:Transcript_23297/g.50936  ORF Transcript_23297/g.50936 Transcript_23297/m.50936 type:complete len:200 (-) Transcript_23297:1238-1837(-)